MIRAPKLRVGYFAQHQIEALRPEDSALQHLARRLPAEREERLRTRLGGFGLTQDKADLPAGALSGGEKARLTFALISAEAPQLLVLDEPTNHLDIDSRDALTLAINDFAGAVLLISHDPHLIELTADRLWLVAGGRVRPFDGDLEDYRRALLEPASTGPPSGAPAEGNPRRAQRQRQAEERARLAPLRQAAHAAERELERLTKERAALAARLADGATYALAGDEIATLIRREAEFKAAIEAAEHRWLDRRGGSGARRGVGAGPQQVDEDGPLGLGAGRRGSAIWCACARSQRPGPKRILTPFPRAGARAVPLAEFISWLPQLGC